MEETEVCMTVNGQARVVRSHPCRSLLEALREDLGLLSVKEGCGQGDCGACVILMDGQAVNSCLVLVGQADGANIVTAEGLAEGGRLQPLQRAFVEHGGFQCGFCTPGMLMSASGLLLDNPAPSTAEIRVAISGNLCRCTGYAPIVEAIAAASEEMSKVAQESADA